jgi:hypothetical protein
MSSFKIINKHCIKKIEDNGVEWMVPTDENNTDYQEYLAWVAEGNEAEEWSAE